MAWTDYLANPITYRLVFEAFITFAMFGGFLAVFWMLGEIPQLSFSLESFLNEYGVVFFLGLVVYRAAQNVLQIAMQGM